MEPDIKAKVTITRQTPVSNGYRQVHLIGNYLTTSMHEYVGVERVEYGGIVEEFTRKGTTVNCSQKETLEGSMISTKAKRKLEYEGVNYYSSSTMGYKM